MGALETGLDDLEVLQEMAAEEQDESLISELDETLNKIKENLHHLELGMLLSEEYDANNAILTLHAGAGGTEAQDWTSMLLRMFTRFAERNGYQVEMLDYLAGDEAGVKSVTLQINGYNAYGFFRSEKGVHRLVRISPFDANARRHTSFSAVDVMPVPGQRRRRTARQQDFFSRSHDPPAYRYRGAVPERAEPDSEP